MSSETLINSNEIVFYFDLDAGYPTYNASNHEKPKTFPALVFALDKTWNDYFTINRFDVFFYQDLNNFENIGKVRIIELSQDEHQYNISDFLKSEYNELPNNFASLGEDKDFYESIHKYFKSETAEVLMKLRDCSVDINARKLAKENYWWSHSLMRSYDNERALRESVSIINGKPVSEMYKFTYNFKSLYFENIPSIPFLFDEQNTYFPRRIYAIIGKNGVGKSQLLSKLPYDILNRKKRSFTDNYIPPFSKIITVSTSFYDKYKRPKSTDFCEYVYCNILDEDNNILSIQKQKELLESNIDFIINNTSKILKVKINNEVLFTTLGEETKKILRILFTNIDIDNSFFIKDTEDHENVLNKEIILDYFENKMSSGESILLYNIFNILANISFNSLLFFDEPETHLHPNAMTDLIAGLSLILETFESFAIIATHSPLVIRELKSDSVLIMKRNEKTVNVHKIGYESLGASVNKLTNDIFKNNETQPYYMVKIKKMHDDGKSYEEIVKTIQSDEEFPLDLRISMYIKSLNLK